MVPAAPADPVLSQLPPASAEQLFGERWPLALRYAAMLCDEGVVRGLLGPREPTRIWDRHLLNCAAAAELLPEAARVADVGSGAGLPGLVLALIRPDVHVTLIESMARRAVFLEEAVDRLGVRDRVAVRHARAEEIVGPVKSARRQKKDERSGNATVAPFTVVTARAVAPLDRLGLWTGGLVGPGGLLLAIRGESAADELRTHGPALVRAGWLRAEVVVVGQQEEVVATVVRAVHR